jgi:predicted transcriptional regulator
MSSRLAAYHLQLLEQDGKVQRLDDAGYTRFFPSIGRPKWSRRDMQFLGVMRHSVALRTTILLLSEGEQNQGAMAKRLDLAKASLSYYLSMMLRDRLVQFRVDGRQRFYSIADPDYVRGMLANFTPGPDELDTFDGIWNDLFGR